MHSKVFFQTLTGANTGGGNIQNVNISCGGLYRRAALSAGERRTRRWCANYQRCLPGALSWVDLSCARFTCFVAQPISQMALQQLALRSACESFGFLSAYFGAKCSLCPSARFVANGNRISNAPPMATGQQRLEKRAGIKRVAQRRWRDITDSRTIHAQYVVSLLIARAGAKMAFSGLFYGQIFL